MEDRTRSYAKTISFHIRDRMLSTMLYLHISECIQTDGHVFYITAAQWSDQET